MEKLSLIAGVLLMWPTMAYSQQEKLEVEGAIQIANSEDPTPDPGTIQFNPATNDFEGWNGTKWISLTRASDGIIGIVYDIEGNVYRTIQIGTQVWMAENLRTSKYQNGDPIGQIKLDADWSETDLAAKGGWCWYGNNNVNDLPYGKLYNWYAVDDSRGLCPIGWHEPTDTEWTTLVDHLDPVDVTNAGGTQSFVSGGKMKEPGFAHWGSPNTGATNESGFTSLGSGFRHTNGLFYDLKYASHWWSSTNHGDNDAWSPHVYFSNTHVIKTSRDKRLGYLVRCLKD